MFQSFNSCARRVVTISFVEARMLGHDVLHCPHVFLALLHLQEQDLAMQQLFGAHGLTSVDYARLIVRDLYVQPIEPDVHMPRSEGAESVFNIALETSRFLDHGLVGPPHILYGILMQDDPGLCHLFAGLDLHSSELLNDLSRCLAQASAWA